MTTSLNNLRPFASKDAEINKLRKRIAEIEADYRRQGNTVVEQGLRIAELEAENERLRKGSKDRG